MPWSIADSVYQPEPTWSNESDRAAYIRAFEAPPDQVQKMAQAMETASPDYPASALRRSAPQTTVVRPPAVTIDSVLDGSAYMPPQMNISDYSGTDAGIEASSRPSLGSGA